jgi:Concanavalin A-like lectin/glucanases superfamily
MNRYKGSIRSATAAPTSSSAAVGIWTQTEAMQAKQANAWPSVSTSGSILLNGSSQYLSANAAQKPTTLGNNLFTLEGFYRFTALPSSLFSLACTADTNFRFFLHSTGILSVWEGSSTRWTSANAGMAINTWYHICIMRSNNGATTTALNFYVNGVSIATTNPINSVTWATGGMLVGAETSQYFINGNVTNFRITNGTAVYNVSGFTPPIAPLTNITNTQLLLLASSSGTFTNDSSTANAGGPYTVTNVGGATYSALSPF